MKGICISLMEEKANEAIERARGFLCSNGYADACNGIGGYLLFSLTDRDRDVKILLDNVFIPSDMSFVYDMRRKSMFSNEHITEIYYGIECEYLQIRMAACKLSDDELKEYKRVMDSEEDFEGSALMIHEDFLQALELASKLIFEE